MKEVTWAEIAHNILLVKQFTLEHLQAISCGRDDQCQEVLSRLVKDGFVKLEGELYQLTTDMGMRFDLLKKVRKIEKADREERAKWKSS